MNVLSLFDGMSCGRVALERAGISVTKYFASEIDKHAIKVAMNNYPDTQQLGDVTKWHEWDLPKIDLLIGGSPCQGFSFAGKQLAFDDPRSKLFFEFVACLEHFKPKYFLLENVRMKKEHLQVITDMLGVEPIRINSNLVSAQNRDRYYWTNIPNVTQPEDKGILLKDILETAPNSDIKGGAIRGRPTPTGKTVQRLEVGGDKANSLTTVQKDSLCVLIGRANLNGHDCIKRIYSVHGKAPTLTAIQGGHQEAKIATDSKHWRKLTPIECERLQTLPDNYTSCVSNSQRYKMIGNGWTVDVIAHIFLFMAEAQNNMKEVA